MDIVTQLNTEDKDYNLGQDVNKKVSGNDRSRRKRSYQGNHNEYNEGDR